MPAPLRLRPCGKKANAVPGASKATTTMVVLVAMVLSPQVQKITSCAYLRPCVRIEERGGYRQTQFVRPSGNVLRRIDKLSSRNVPGIFFSKTRLRRLLQECSSVKVKFKYDRCGNVLRWKAQVRRLFSRNVLRTFKTNSVQSYTVLRLFFYIRPHFPSQSHLRLDPMFI